MLLILLRKPLKIDSKKEFIKLFNKLTRQHNPYTVFADFVKLSSIALHNGAHYSEELESEYMQIINSYDKKHIDIFPKLLGCCVEALEVMNDFLGDIFMELEIGNKKAGQFFTPYHLSKMMATMLHAENAKLLDTKPFMNLSEPACGAGGMVIAYADAMLDAGHNPQRQLYAQCIDVDSTAAMMCYLQLSLLGIPAEIVTGNALTLSTHRVMRTPMYYLHGWQYKL